MSTAPRDELNTALEGHYRIERQLGEGGMATVYLAQDLKHNRKVALKVLKPELAAVVGAERFLAEIETTAQLTHPHILPLFDSGETDGFLFYVMPYVEGESLRERLDREHQLPVDEAVQIAKNVAEALDYAHRQGVIHRDVKPANILLQDGEPVVSDFGIALALGYAGGGRLTETGLSLGTPTYVSPEQATGDVSVGPATDIWALGCVLYEMLVGTPPYSGSTAQAILGKIITGSSPPVAEQRQSVPPNVDAAIRCALEEVPADRFASAGDFARALGDLSFRYGPAPGLAGSPLRRHPTGVALVAAIVGSLATAVATWSVASPGAERSPTAVTRFGIALSGLGTLRGNTVQALEVSADGRSVFANLYDEGESRVYARPLGSLSMTPVPRTENVGSFFVSPDGQWVAFNNNDGTLRKVPVSGGQAITVADGLASGGFRGASWGAGGTIVYASSSYDGLMRVSDAGGTSEPLTFPDSLSLGHYTPHFLPDGERVLFTIPGPETVAIALLNLSTGEYEPLTVGRFPQYVAGGYLVFLRGNTIWAADLDVERARLLAGPVPVIGGVEPVRPDAVGPRGFSVSANGTLVYAPEIETGGQRSLVWVERDGAEQSLPVDRQPYLYPRLSPAGDRLAIAVAEEVETLGGPADLWVFDLERFARTRVTFGGNHRFYPIWTPDGSALTHSDGSTAENSLLVSAADGVGGTDTLLPVGPRRFPTSWSPDGSALAYYAGPFGMPTETRDLFILRVDGDDVSTEPFLATPFQDRAPVFSPDGRWIAYVSDKSGRNEVYVVPFPGPGSESTVSTDGGSEPVWAPDGTELFYRSEDRLMVVDVHSSDTFRAGSPRPLFEDRYERDPAGGAGIPNYDVSADGQRFLMVRPDPGDTPDELVVVQNWVEEVRERLRN